MSQSDKPAVSIVKCAACDSAEGIADGLRHACDLVGGLESVIMPGDTVLIKPNLVLPFPYQTGATTNPHLVEALALQCREKGAKHIVIGDGSCVDANTEDAFDACGYRELAERVGAELVEVGEGGLPLRLGGAGAHEELVAVLPVVAAAAADVVRRLVHVGGGTIGRNPALS